MKLAPSVASFAARLGSTLLVCAFAIGWFLYLGYGAILAPTHVTWLLRNDWAAYHWGFSFFRNSDWAFPLGNTPELFYPFGTSVAFTDANPWASTAFKLFSPWLPVDFQFHGLWFLLCFVAQGVFGARIAIAMSDDKARQVLGGCMFVVTPILPARAPHIALCGLFFVTAGLYLHVRKIADRGHALRDIGGALLLLVWAAGTHGYLSVMLLALVLSWIVRLGATDRLLSARAASVAALAAIGATVATYCLFGYIGWKPAQLTEEGFGQFSGDLTALVNPQGWSRFFTTLPYRPRQGEGFLYLGTGVFFLLLVALASIPRICKPVMIGFLRRHWGLMLILGLMWLYSLSSHIAYLGEVVLNLEELYRPFSQWTGIFRSSGRFAWPLHLALIALGVFSACAIARPWLGRSLLVVALLLQVSELKAERLNFADVPMRPLANPVWQTVRRDYQHLRLTPIHLRWVCQYRADIVNRLSYEAYRRKLTFNSGNFMRKEPGVKRLCRERIEPGDSIDPLTIYVVNPRDVASIESNGATCGTLDDLTICVSNEKNTQLRNVLMAGLPSPS